MNHQHVILLGQRDHTLEEVQLDALGGRVGREAQDHHLGLGDRFANRPLQLVEEVHAWHQRHRTHLGTGDHRAVDVDRVTGIGHQYRVAMVEGAKHQVRQAFLGADGDDGFGFRVDVDLVALPVPA